MAPSTRASGSHSQTEKAKRTEEEFKYGQMVPDTMVFGATVWLMAMVVLFMLRVTFMKASGPKTRLMAMVSIRTSTAVATKVSGLLTSNMASASSNGPMEPSTMASMSRA